jgi:hypothetical protein
VYWPRGKVVERHLVSQIYRRPLRFLKAQKEGSDRRHAAMLAHDVP